ncbi:MAG: hypothetical protein ACFE94_09550 [Candidatus Hodarchaeota archaeon]
MEEMRTKDSAYVYIYEHIWKVLSGAAVLIVLGLILPAGFSDLGPLSDTYMWIFGFWFSTSDFVSPSAGWPSDFYVEPHDAALMTGGIVAVILLIFALIIISTASRTAKYEGVDKVAAGTGLIGGILAIIGPAFYYYYLDSEIVEMGVSVHWMTFDPSFGFYLPILGGVLGILSAIAIGYAYTLETKRKPEDTIPSKPTPDKIAMDKELEVINQQEVPKFCKNCGTKLVGEYCQECGQKA